VSDSTDSKSLASGCDADQKTAPRYIVGIDLGTTNCALCWTDTEVANGEIQTFSIAQIVSEGQTERLETLPSFHLECGGLRQQSGSCRLPWQSSGELWTTGVFARDQGRLAPGRVIESAKSWLCHPGVDRRAAILPWNGAADVARLSPVEASARCLQHLREAWNSQHPQHLLEQQDVVLTIPASFDEVARELTVAAARMAGLPRVVLLEEPQAAFYAWVHEHRDSWEQLVAPGQKILVCDIGGGTTDFSLIDVRAGGGDKVQFHRIAVGEHLLLGGDNLDLAIAHFVEQRLGSRDVLDERQWGMLLAACRQAKEVLLSESGPETFSLSLGGSGSRLIGGGLQVQLQRSEIVQLILDGFLPAVELSDAPIRKQSGFREFGLPYAADAAISRYLAEFLRIQGESVRPDFVLFNGGFFESPILRQRFRRLLESMFCPADSGWSPQLLTNPRLDLAVAQGAAVFGLARRGRGVRIAAGLARTYYVGVEQSDGVRAALCLVAAGTESSVEPIVLEQIFQVRTAEPVEFPVYVSGARTSDKPGQLIPVDPEQLTALPPVRTVLNSRRRGDSTVVDARLAVRLTEIGTLELWCQQVHENRRWQLQFDVRSAVETDRTAHGGTGESAGIVDDATISSARDVLRSVFNAQAGNHPDQVISLLTQAVGQPRAEWPPSLLRAIWKELLDLESGRRRSPVHESRWLNLAGYCLRPGFGYAADDWRVEEMWRVAGPRPVHGAPACLAEHRTMCRRIAGGFSAGRQTQIAGQLLPALRQRFRQVQSGRGKAVPYASGNHEAAEIWRLLGSLELLDLQTRQELGEMSLDLIFREEFSAVRSALVWTLGRVGGRLPVYGPLNLVLPTPVVCSWLERLLKMADVQDSGTQLTIMQMCRRTGDRFRDVPAALRTRAASALRAVAARPALVTVIEDGGPLDEEATGQVLGESLPAGLRLLSAGMFSR